MYPHSHNHYPQNIHPQNTPHTSQYRGDELLAELMMMDFMLVDLALYLNTHGDDHHAHLQYNNAARHAAALRAEYERTNGPLHSFRSMAPEARWTWADQPWPWEFEANFNFVDGGI